MAPPPPPADAPATIGLARSRFSGFYKHSVAERRALLGLDVNSTGAFDVQGGLQLPVANRMIENVVGVLGLPLGVALNFIVDGEEVVVPMAVEEASIVAACSHIARLAAAGGGFTTSADPPITVGQVQLLHVSDLDRVRAAIAEAHTELLNSGNLLCPGLKDRGGGVVDIRCRVLARLPAHDLHGDLDDGGPMLVVEVVMLCGDAMGANAVNTVVEGLSQRLESLSGGHACLRILTNLADERCAHATMRIPFASLSTDEKDGAAVARGIVDAYRFAARDPWRACTHNKGIMNGVDAVAIATGNDWRALEAGAHAYAARSGRYTSLSRFSVDHEAACLVGSITLPMAVGVVGGATRVHPTVQAARALLGPFALSTTRLAGLMAAVGLAQNTGALKAMVTEGIQRGHMALHARQIALAAGATAAEVETVAGVLVHEARAPVGTTRGPPPRLGRAQQVLADLRSTYE